MRGSQGADEGGARRRVTPTVLRQSGAEAVFALLREEIIVGDLPPEAPLREVELAERLGVSRTPVREALRLLYGERLVTRRPTGGFVVAPLEAGEMRNVYNVRAVLEGLAAREAATRITEERLATLGDLLQQMELLKPQATEVVKAGVEFHRIVLEAADNTWAQVSLDQLRGHIDRYRQLSTASAGRPDAAVREHRLIYHALAAREPETAERAMRTHIERGGEVALEAVFGSA